ncbi:MAG: hypothetical protein PVI73_10620 [Syntrophobacterales bacterium]
MKTILYLGAEVGAAATEEVVADRAKVVMAPATQEDVQVHIKTCDALLDASMKVRITDTMVASAANLKIISCATTGSDHIERGELERRSIPVRTLMEDRELLLNLTPAAELCCRPPSIMSKKADGPERCFLESCSRESESGLLAAAGLVPG